MVNSTCCGVKMLLKAVVFCMLCTTLSSMAGRQQSIDTFPYPKPEGEVRRFDDKNPIWGPNLSLSFERTYKGNGGGQEIYWYQPFGENKAVAPLVVRSNSLVLDFGAPERSQFFASYFSWVNYRRESRGSQTRSIYRFVYTQLPHLYFGELDVRGSAANLSPTLREQQFVIGGDFQNKYADYAEGNGYVAFVSGFTGQGDIYIKRLPDTKPIDENNVGMRVTENNVLNLAPRWSPDGAHLAYSSESGGNQDVFLLKNLLAADKTSLNPDRESIRLTSSKLHETFPTWSPDGAFIAFYTTRRESNDTDDPLGKTSLSSSKPIYDLWVVGIDSRQPIQIAENVYRQTQSGPIWMPPLSKVEGPHLIFTSGTFDKIYVVNVHQAMTHSGGAQLIPVEGLVGKHIEHLDCTQFRGASIVLAYSAHNEQGQMRIYVERIEHMTPDSWRSTYSILPE